MIVEIQPLYEKRIIKIKKEVRKSLIPVLTKPSITPGRNGLLKCFANCHNFKKESVNKVGIWKEGSWGAPRPGLSLLTPGELGAIRNFAFSGKECSFS